MQDSCHGFGRFARRNLSRLSEFLQLAMQIALFYGSSTGATARIAAEMKAIIAELAVRKADTSDPSPPAKHLLEATHSTEAVESAGPVEVELLDVSEFYLEEMLDFEYLILGIPTWNHGQLQSDWEVVFEEFDGLALAGKKFAIFGLGDQLGYPDTFGDAVFFLAEKVRAQGGALYGRWPTDGYSFRRSWATEDGEFLGLLLDEDNQPELSQIRMTRWLSQVLDAFCEA